MHLLVRPALKLYLRHPTSEGQFCCCCTTIIVILLFILHPASFSASSGPQLPTSLSPPFFLLPFWLNCLSKLSDLFTPYLLSASQYRLFGAAVWRHTVLIGRISGLLSSHDSHGLDPLLSLSVERPIRNSSDPLLHDIDLWPHHGAHRQRGQRDSPQVLAGQWSTQCVAGETQHCITLYWRK